MNYMTRHKDGLLIQSATTTILPKGLYQVLNEHALIGGSSLKGRLDAAKYLLGITHIPPVYINQNCTFIQTHSLRNTACFVIQEQSILYLSPMEGKTMVYFRDGQTVEVKLSIRLFRKRIADAHKLMEILHSNS